MPKNEWDPVAADNAAAEAEQELNQMMIDEKISQKDLDLITDWWYRWFIKAGHKRLGRILVSYAKEKESEKPVISLGKDGKFHNGKDNN